MAIKPSSGPLFSIVTVSKNNLDGLRRTHAALEAQTFKDFEWIVADGASEDGTKDFLKTVKAKWTSEPDEGLFDAMNMGLKKATGKYVLFLNAGDTLAKPDTLEKIVKITAKEPDFIYGDSLETGKDAAKPFYKTAGRYRDLPKGMFTHHQAMFYRLDKIREEKLWYSVIYDIAADYEFTARFLSNAKKIVYAPLPVCLFESGGISQQKASEGRREEFIIREKLKLVSLPHNVFIYATQTLAWHVRKMFPQLYESLKGKKRGGEEETIEKESKKSATTTKPNGST